MTVWADRRLMTMFMERAAADRLDVLKGDKAYFDLCCKQIPPHAHPWTIDGYARAWVAAMQAEPVEHFRQQTGRFAANQWLMAIMKKKGLPIPTGQEMQELKFGDA